MNLTLATDSLDIVMNKFNDLINALDRAHTFDEGGYVKNELWFGTIDALENFLSSNTNTVSQLEVEAKSDTGDLNIFNLNYKKTASREQLSKWIHSTWSTVSQPNTIPQTGPSDHRSPKRG